MKNKAKIIELDKNEVAELQKRIRKNILTDTDRELLIGIIDSYKYINLELEKKNVSINRLRKVFNIKSEKSSNVLPNKNKSAKDKSPEKVKKKGHGRLKASDYKDAKKVIIDHSELKKGDKCPFCKGKLYDNTPPGIFVKFKGQPSFKATIYEQKKLRCNLCSAIFEAPLPDGIDKTKYDESASSMLILLKYGMGLPIYRLAALQNYLDTPFPKATQWKVIEEAVNKVYPLYKYLEKLAAQGEVIHNDDTNVKILSLIKENEELDSKDRRGMFTTGIISKIDDKKIVLFYSGRNHAGENMEKVLIERADDRAPPIQMCDGLSRNIPKKIKTLLSNCLSHGRRYFVDCINANPKECEYVIELLGTVYKHDKFAKLNQLSGDERLKYHQKNSGSIMNELKKWMENQFELKLIEPNSNLGTAIKYMQNHWEAMTLFLRIPGVPLDNNILEQSLKRAILHRKNSLFYKNLYGASVGDIFMSIINTCVHAKVNPYKYLIHLQKNYQKISQIPSSYLPWNYENH